jgi:hypothetical protein
MTWHEMLREGASRMTVNDLRPLLAPELSVLDCEVMAAPVALEVADRLARRGRIGDAVRALDAAVRHAAAGDASRLAQVAQFVGGKALLKQDAAALRKCLSWVAPGNEIRRLLETGLRVLECTDPVLEALEGWARDGLEDDDELAGLAYSLIDRCPALGVLVARHAVRAGPGLENEMLLTSIEVARDALNLQPFDPVWEEFDEHLVKAAIGSLGAGAGGPAGDDGRRTNREIEVEELGRRLSESGARVSQLERELHEKTRELSKLGAPDPQGPSSRAEVRQHDESETLRRLREKVRELQGQVAEGNKERAGLRAELKDVAKGRSVASPSPERGPVEGGADALEIEVEPDLQHRLRVPDFASVKGSLLSLPPRVARDTVARVADLASGGEPAWRDVKALAGMRSRVYSARVGIHYRVLFRLDTDCLEVLQVVPRESLDTIVRRLRRG